MATHYVLSQSHCSHSLFLLVILFLFIDLSRLLIIRYCREIDAFIFHLKNTLNFFISLETSGSLANGGGANGGEDAGDDAFVPFI
jgi:hypothetical protein